MPRHETMRRFQIQLEVSNLLVNMEGRVSRHGFLTFRAVTAIDAASAAQLAIASLQDDAALQGMIQNTADDPPVTTVLEIVELTSPESGVGDSGRIWYAESPKRWWQFWRR